MTLLLNLYLGHLLGDFVFQPGRLVVAKRSGVLGLAIHVGVIGAVTAAILFSQLNTFWNIVLLAMAAHMGIEIVTIKARNSQKLSGLSIFLIDQAMHITSLVVLVLVAAPEIGTTEILTFGSSVDPVWVGLACALIAVSFMGSIISFELVNSVGPSTWNRDILPYDLPRVLGLVERGSALLFAVLLHPAMLVFPFLPRVMLALRKPEEEKAKQMLIATSGLLVTAAGWALVMMVSMSAHGSTP